MAGLWLILPESLKEMIEGITYLGIMGAAMFLISKVTAGMAETGEEK
jgi:hypothetical protein